MTRTKNFLRQNVFKVFLKTTFFHDSCQPDHYEPKIFFRFSKSGSTLRYKILIVFLETTFLQCSCYSDHYEPKIFFGTQL